MGDIWDNYDPQEHYARGQAERERKEHPDRQRTICRIIERVLARHQPMGLSRFSELVRAVYQLENPKDYLADSEMRDYVFGKSGVCTLERLKVVLVTPRTKPTDVLPPWAQQVDRELQRLERSNSAQVRDAVWLLRSVLPFHLGM